MRKKTSKTKRNMETELISNKSEKKKKKFSGEKKHHICLLGKTIRQENMIDSCYKNKLIIVTGPAGTGKTYLATGYACKEMVNNKFDKIIISRSNVPTGRTLGHFPGTIEEKLTPWVAQTISYMSGFVGSGTVDCWQRNKQIQMIPMETMRGWSFDNACVIIDEAQNLTMEELKCITTRIGENSKLILCGDTNQSDLRKVDFKTFSDLVIVHDIRHSEVIEFTIDECFRSNIVKDLLHMFDRSNI